MAEILLDAVTVTRGGSPVIEGLSLRVEDGEAVSILGPSGSGKSTILRAIAGLDPVVSGDVLFDGVPVTDRTPASRDVAMVFQEDALFSFMTARRNVAFPLEVRRVPKEEAATRVQAEASVLAIEHILDRLPGRLSAGEQQLVQAARALVRRPAVFLLDEPLARIDRAKGEALRRELSLLQRGYRVTTLLATNDQAEAMAFADRLVVLDSGRIRQIGPPLEVYDQPADVFVATFVGQPTMALLPAEVRTGRVVAGGWSAPAPLEAGAVTLGVRPEAWGESPDGLEGEVETTEWHGDHGFAMVRFPMGSATIRVGADLAAGTGGRWAPTGFHLFDPTSGRALFHVA